MPDPDVNMGSRATLGNSLALRPALSIAAPGHVELVVIAGLDPAIHPLSQEDGCAGQVYSPETSPTGVRGHDRHVIIAWIRLPGRAIHAMARGVDYGPTS